MTSAEIVKKIMDNSRMSQAKLAELSGFKHQSNVTGILNRGSTLKVNNLQRLVSVMGYEIVVRPVDGDGPSFVVDDLSNDA